MPDDIDLKIIKILKLEARKPYLDIAKALGMSEGAVRRRIKKLVDSGFIKKFTVETIQEGPEAIMLVSANTSVPTSKISNVMLKMEGVKKVYEVTGEFDIVALLSASDTPKLNSCIEETRRIRGTNRTNTMMVLRRW